MNPTPEDIARDDAAHYKRVGFTEAMIRACKHRCSGRGVDFKWIVGQVAGMDAKYVTDRDVAYHLAVAYVEIFAPTSARNKLIEIIQMALSSDDVRGKVISDIGHTVVDELRQRGLWTEVAVLEDAFE